jgi:hypothetical protein
MIPFFFVFTLFWVHHGFNTCKLLLIEFLTNLLQDFFLGLEGKSSESCFLPKERQTETVSDFFLSWVKQQPLGFIACYFIFSCFVGTNVVYSLLTYARFLCIIWVLKMGGCCCVVQISDLVGWRRHGAGVWFIPGGPIHCCCQGKIRKIQYYA